VALSVDINPLKTEFHLNNIYKFTLYVSATQTDRLMLFRETASIHCENHAESTQIRCVGEMRFSVMKQVVRIVTAGL
jgi:hypothetical protein